MTDSNQTPSLEQVLAEDFTSREEALSLLEQALDRGDREARLLLLQLIISSWGLSNEKSIDILGGGGEHHSRTPLYGYTFAGGQSANADYSVSDESFELQGREQLLSRIYREYLTHSGFDHDPHAYEIPYQGSTINIEEGFLHAQLPFETLEAELEIAEKLGLPAREFLLLEAAQAERARRALWQLSLLDACVIAGELLRTPDYWSEYREELEEAFADNAFALERLKDEAALAARLERRCKELAASFVDYRTNRWQKVINPSVPYTDTQKKRLVYVARRVAGVRESNNSSMMMLVSSFESLEERGGFLSEETERWCAELLWCEDPELELEAFKLGIALNAERYQGKPRPRQFYPGNNSIGSLVIKKLGQCAAEGEYFEIALEDAADYSSRGSLPANELFALFHDRFLVESDTTMRERLSKSLLSLAHKASFDGGLLKRTQRCIKLMWHNFYMVYDVDGAWGQSGYTQRYPELEREDADARKLDDAARYWDAFFGYLGVDILPWISCYFGKKHPLVRLHALRAFANLVEQELTATAEISSNGSGVVPLADVASAIRLSLLDAAYATRYCEEFSAQLAPLQQLIFSATNAVVTDEFRRQYAAELLASACNMKHRHVRVLELLLQPEVLHTLGELEDGEQLLQVFDAAVDSFFQHERTNWDTQISTIRSALGCVAEC